MFMTQNHTEELLGRPFGREHFWSRVELAYDDIWFYVSTGYSRVGGKVRRYYLLTKPSDLVALIDESRDTSQLKELIAVADSSDLISIDYIYQFTDELCYATRDISEINALSWRQTLYSEEKHAFPDDSER